MTPETNDAEGKLRRRQMTPKANCTK